MLPQLLVIVLLLCTATQALSEEAVVFSDPAQVYVDLFAFKGCMYEKSLLEEMVRVNESQMSSSDKHIDILKKQNEICNDYAIGLQGITNEVRAMAKSEREAYEKIDKSLRDDSSFVNRLYRHSGSFGIGVLVGVFTAIAIR